MACEIPEPLREKLERGSVLPKGTTLTSDECWALLQLLPQSPGRPENHMVNARDQIVAQLFTLYVANGDSSKTAVHRLKDRFGMSRSQIYDARKRYPRDFENLDPSERRELIIAYENNPLV
jgi:hypothetical protein